MRELYIDGAIVDDDDMSGGGCCPSAIRAELAAFDAEEPIELHINSGGGSVVAGVAIANMIGRHKGKTTAYCDGLCASIATQIFFSADSCIMPANTFLMIHMPTTETAGNAAGLRKSAAQLDVIQRGLETTYMKKARDGVKAEQIHEMMNAETWLTAADAAALFKITVIEPLASLNALGFDVLRAGGIKIPSAVKNCFERKDERMKTWELRQAIADKEFEVESLRRKGDRRWGQASTELSAMKDALEFNLQREEEEHRVLNQAVGGGLARVNEYRALAPSHFTPIENRGTSENAKRLYNRAFNKLVLSGARQAPANLTDEERQAYYNVSGSPGAPGQIEAVPSRGGYLVSPDQMRTLQEYRQAFVALKDYCNVIAAGSNSGRWPTLPQQNIEFHSFVEMTDLDEDELTFDELQYAIEDYGLIIPCSNQLLEDNDVDLLGVIGRTLAQGAVKTENRQILALLTPMLNNATVISDYKGLVTALYKTLDGVYEPSAKVFCNQDGFVWMSNLEDGNNRPLLIPDVTAPNTYLFRGREIVILPNVTLGNTVSGANTYAPIFVGDMQTALTFFERKGFELSTSSEYLWRKNAFACRGVIRFDVVATDPNALIALKVAV